MNYPKEVNQRDNFQTTQLQIVFRYLSNYIATASMVSADTGIPQKNVCRYKRQLEKAGLLWELRKSKCRETGHDAWYLTTDLYKVGCS